MILCFCYHYRYCSCLADDIILVYVIIPVIADDIMLVNVMISVIDLHCVNSSPEPRMW